jgi:hypothetical protein
MNLWKSVLLRLTLMSPDSVLLFRHLCNWVLILSVFTQIIGYGSQWSHTWWGQVIIAPANIVSRLLPGDWQQSWQRNAETTRSGFGKKENERAVKMDKWWEYFMVVAFGVSYGYGFIGLPPLLLRGAARSVQREYKELYDDFRQQVINSTEKTKFTTRRPTNR